VGKMNIRVTDACLHEAKAIMRTIEFMSNTALTITRRGNWILVDDDYKSDNVTLRYDKRGFHFESTGVER